MNQPTDLAAVRAAAERLADWYGPGTGHGHDYVIDEGMESDDASVLADYILQTIPADATLPIDATWLREVWGAWRHMQPSSSCNLTIGKGPVRIVYYFDFDLSKVKWSMNTDDGAMWIPVSITTRHQFTQLMTALGIQPQPPKAKE